MENTFKTITGTISAEIVRSREQAIEQCKTQGKPFAFADRALHCYRVIAPGSIDDFTAILMGVRPTSERIKPL